MASRMKSKTMPVDEVPSPETTTPDAGKSRPMEIRRVTLDQLHSDPGNVRVHNDRNLAVIRSSLASFGQVEPLVVQKGTGKVIGGNGRLEAMRALGWTECDIVEVDEGHVRSAALGLILNRSAETAEWNYEGLGDTIRALQAEDFDISVLGWQDHELEPLLAADWTPPSVEELPEGEESKDEPEDDDPGVIRVTAEQRATIDRAILRVRTVHGDMTLSEGWCVGLVCAEYLREPT